MKVIHATWEKRNMGVDTWEIEVERGDAIENIIEALKENGPEYSVVKIPTDLHGISFELQTKGFSYVETMMMLRRNVAKPILSPMQERILKKMSYREMGADEEDRLFGEIRKGMFHTDRIYVDPAFSEEQAHNRYLGWIGDEKSLGAKCYVIAYKEKDVGFFVMRQKGDLAFPCIAGMYQGENIVGIGVAMDYFEIIEAQKLNCKKIVGAVSTNNTPALNVALQLGYSIEKAMAVYVRHGGID